MFIHVEWFSTRNGTNETVRDRFRLPGWHASAAKADAVQAHKCCAGACSFVKQRNISVETATFLRWQAAPTEKSTNYWISLQFFIILCPTSKYLLLIQGSHTLKHYSTGYWILGCFTAMIFNVYKLLIKIFHTTRPDGNQNRFPGLYQTRETVLVAKMRTCLSLLFVLFFAGMPLQVFPLS